MFCKTIIPILSLIYIKEWGLKYGWIQKWYVNCSVKDLHMSNQGDKAIEGCDRVCDIGVISRIEDFLHEITLPQESYFPRIQQRVEYSEYPLASRVRSGLV